MEGLIDTAPFGFLSLDDGGVIVAVNQTLAEALGTPPRDLTGAPIRSILTPGARIYYQTHLVPLLRLQGTMEEVYLSLRTASGKHLPVLLNARRDVREGQTVHDMAVVPIERRSRFEDEILEARREAETASRSRARFLSMLSHDIRSPLSAMVMAADLLARQAVGPVSDAQKAELERIGTAGRYVLRLVSDVLDFSRLESGRADVRREPVGVDEAVARVLDLVEGQAREAGVEIMTPEGPPGTGVWADPDRLQQVLLNLVGNAIKFTGRGGRVALLWSGEATEVRICVRDTGPGIAPDQQETLFAPFVQGDDARGRTAELGVGLGLSISRELVRAMGGDLFVESEAGEGATFIVHLPATSEA